MYLLATLILNNKIEEKVPFIRKLFQAVRSHNTLASNWCLESERILFQREEGAVINLEPPNKMAPATQDDHRSMTRNNFHSSKCTGQKQIRTI